MTEVLKGEKIKKMTNIDRIREVIDWNGITFDDRQGNNILRVFYSGFIIWPVWGEEPNRHDAELPIGDLASEMQIRQVLKIFLSHDLENFSTNCLQQLLKILNTQSNGMSAIRRGHKPYQSPRLRELIELVQSHINDSSLPQDKIMKSKDSINTNGDMKYDETYEIYDDEDDNIF